MEDDLIPVKRTSDIPFPADENVTQPSGSKKSKTHRNWIKKQLMKANKKKKEIEKLKEDAPIEKEEEEEKEDMSRENLLLGQETFERLKVLEPDLGFAWREVRDNKIKVSKIKLICPLLRTNLRKNEIKTLLPVQSEVIPWLISSRTRPVLNDLCVSYPTGSGKTLAYVVPVIQYLMNRFVPRIRALVILPVQELAQQVYRVFHTYVKGTDVRVVLACGAQSLNAEKSNIVRKNLDGSCETLADVLVTTPGRLIEHIHSTEGFTLAFLNYLIIDEADRLLNNSQNQWFFVLMKHLEEEKTGRYANYELPRMQKCLFSATLTKDPEILKPLKLDSPIYFSKLSKEQIKGQISVPHQIEENFIIADESTKPLITLYFGNKWGKCLCFTNSTKEAGRLALLLKSFELENYDVYEYTQAIPKEQREETLKKFEESNDVMLVTCDRMARGIDIRGVKNVIQYSPPKDLKGYVHRIGRTGRAGESGRALTIVTDKQHKGFLHLLQPLTSNPTLINIEEENMETFKNLYKTAKGRFNESLKNVLLLEKTNEKNAKLDAGRRIARKRHHLELIKPNGSKQKAKTTRR